MDGKNTSVIKIDRSGIDFKDYLTEGTKWNIAEQNNLSSTLSEIDIEKVLFKFPSDEVKANGEEYIKSVSENEVPLDAYAFVAFWNNKDLIAERFKENHNKQQPIFRIFPGTIFENGYPGGPRYVLYLCVEKDKIYHGYLWLGLNSWENKPIAYVKGENFSSN